MEYADYYLSTNKKWFRDFAVSLSQHIGQHVHVEGNSLVFPPSVAEGRFEFYELSDGLSILLVDCVFYKSLKLSRAAVRGTEYYKIFFNAGDARLIIEKNSGRRVDTGMDMSEAVLFTSNSVPVSFVTPVGSRVRDVELIFHRSWAHKHIPDILPEEAVIVKDIKDGKAVQFTATIDLACLDIVNEMLDTKMDAPSAYPYIEGLALQLFSSFIRNEIVEQVGENFIYSNENKRIAAFVEKQEQNLDLRLPSLEEAAIECNMGRSKFISLFMAHYKESYGSFFVRMKLNKAYEMLLQNRSVTDVAHSVGYNNVGNFIKAFRGAFGLSPKQAKQRVFEKMSKISTPNSRIG
ncbi:MAG: helix-turn-helix transcriptional regulator [Filimonas sp.]|nr:helix-turn-helix transcriptional regulator [Filimonas sp.]